MPSPHESPELARCFLKFYSDSSQKKQTGTRSSTTRDAVRHGKPVARPATVPRAQDSTSIQEQQRFWKPARPRCFVVGCALIHDHFQPLRPHSVLAQDGLQFLHTLYDLLIVFGILRLARAHGKE